MATDQDFIDYVPGAVVLPFAAVFMGLAWLARA